MTQYQEDYGNDDDDESVIDEQQRWRGQHRGDQPPPTSQTSQGKSFTHFIPKLLFCIFSYMTLFSLMSLLWTLSSREDIEKFNNPKDAKNEDLPKPEPPIDYGSLLTLSAASFFVFVLLFMYRRSVINIDNFFEGETDDINVLLRKKGKSAVVNGLSTALKSLYVGLSIFVAANIGGYIYLIQPLQRLKQTSDSTASSGLNLKSIANGIWGLVKIYGFVIVAVTLLLIFLIRRKRDEYDDTKPSEVEMTSYQSVPSSSFTGFGGGQRQNPLQTAGFHERSQGHSHPTGNASNFTATGFPVTAAGFHDMNASPR
jgi:hypothetical protein